MHLRRELTVLAVAALLSPICFADPVPFWGAKAPDPIDTDPRTLKPGHFVWYADAAPEGPIVMIVSLPEQRARVYRNGISIGVSTVSTGRPGYVTPTGVFTILNKDRDHRSNKYNDAPMPYSERLTWGGVALHAGGLPGYPESHGCIHLPSRFAQLLFEITKIGMTVVISNDAVDPVEVAHPAFFSPVDVRGDVAADPRLAAEAVSRWEPEKSPAGPVTVVLSAADRRIIVFRNGVEIGRSRIEVRDPETPLDNGAFLLQGDAPESSNVHAPAGTRWIGIPLPGATIQKGTVMNADKAARVTIPPAFVANVLGVLSPGSTLVVTDRPILAQETGPAVSVLDSDPPAASHR
jgi:hypothetical protein